jgi:hypothetical protein
VGVVGGKDRAGRRILEQGSVPVIVDATDPPGRFLGAITSATVASPVAHPVAPMLTVTGPRGAPGRSEIAVALAWVASSRGNTLLVELDDDAPGLGLRLGLEPVLAGAPRRQQAGPIELLSLPAGGGPLSASLARRLIEGARTSFDTVVVDAGPIPARHGGFHGGRAVLVVQPSPTGLVRAGHVVAAWEGHAPILVANRMPEGSEHATALEMIRAATGLEPAVAIPELDIQGLGAHPVMTKLLAPVIRSVIGRSQRRAAR